MGEFAQTLSAVNALTSRALEGAGVSDVADSSGQAQEVTRSYLVKRGDEDVQDQYRATSQVRPSHGTGISTTGGALTASAKTKDEMDQARRARLEKLEAEQAQRKKQ